MNEQSKAETSSILTRRLGGLAWFIGPVAFNALWLLAAPPIYDGGLQRSAEQWFSIPYWLLVVIIGVRRVRRVTIGDFLFLAFGNFIITAILLRLHPAVRALFQ
jgi:hypothetical protein